MVEVEDEHDREVEVYLRTHREPARENRFSAIACLRSGCPARRERGRCLSRRGAPRGTGDRRRRDWPRTWPHSAPEAPDAARPRAAQSPREPFMSRREFRALISDPRPATTWLPRRRRRRHAVDHRADRLVGDGNPGDRDRCVLPLATHTLLVAEEPDRPQHHDVRRHGASPSSSRQAAMRRRSRSRTSRRSSRACSSSTRDPASPSSCWSRWPSSRSSSQPTSPTARSSYRC